MCGGQYLEFDSWWCVPVLWLSWWLQWLVQTGSLWIGYLRASVVLALLGRLLHHTIHKWKFACFLDHTIRVSLGVQNCHSDWRAVCSWMVRARCWIHRTRFGRVPPNISLWIGHVHSEHPLLELLAWMAWMTILLKLAHCSGQSLRSARHQWPVKTVMKP